jgi:hypothetical protein
VQLCSLGLEVSVDIGSLVADNREEVVGEDLAKVLVLNVDVTVGINHCTLDIKVELIHGMLSEQGSEDGALGL